MDIANKEGLKMRITGGRYCGRRVVIPPGIIRPAMDRMRESLFSILCSMESLENLSFVDLFSGSGCIGIEAASRGANPVHLVEMDRLKKETIEKNISYVEEDIKLFLNNVLKFIPETTFKYDIVYADPPFPMDGKLNIAKLADKHEIIKPNGLFVIHYPDTEDSQWPNQIGKLTLIDTRRYGRNMIKFYRNQETE